MTVHLLGVLSLDLHILFKCIFLYSEYIQVIMSMEESVQHVVMMAIQEVCSTAFLHFICCSNPVTPRPRYMYAEMIIFTVVIFSF